MIVMRMRLKRLLSASLIALMAVAGGVVVAAPAQAATVISINVAVTGNQCPTKGPNNQRPTVTRVNVSITDPGISGSVGSTSGSQVNGLKTFSGYRSLIQGSNFCQTSWYGSGYYSYWSVYRYVYNNGQTTYI